MYLRTVFGSRPSTPSNGADRQSLTMQIQDHDELSKLDHPRRSLRISRTAMVGGGGTPEGAAALRYTEPPRHGPFRQPCQLGNFRCPQLGSIHRPVTESPQVLHDRRQRELELCAVRAAKTQSVKPQNALEVRKQHLDLLAITARLRVGRGFGKRACDIASGLMDVAFGPSRWHFGAALALSRQARHAARGRDTGATRRSTPPHFCRRTLPTAGAGQSP